MDTGRIREIRFSGSELRYSLYLCRNNLLGVVLWKIPVFLGSAQLGSNILGKIVRHAEL